MAGGAGFLEPTEAAEGSSTAEVTAAVEDTVPVAAAMVDTVVVLTKIRGLKQTSKPNLKTTEVARHNAFLHMA